MRLSNIIFMILLAPLLVCCGKKKVWEKPLSDDFASLTGKNLPTWEYVKTPTDLEYLALFNGIYEKQKGYIKQASLEMRIPKVIHFIWIGPRPFPLESVENVRTWIANNPGWAIKFWTDRERPAPAPEVEMVQIKDLHFLKLADCYSKSDNYGEKSDLLRYEILYREGGVYVDHDVKCFKAFDPLNAAYDFYCGIDMPFHSGLPSSVFPTNNLIGIRPGHPILMHCMELLSSKWDEIGAAYPGADRDATLNRVLHRTFLLFGESIKQVGNQEGNRDMVFPAYYFDAPDDQLAIFARHQYAGTWHETESAFEKMVRQRLMLLSKKSNKTLLFFGLMTTLNLFGFITLFVMIRKRLPRTS